MPTYSLPSQSTTDLLDRVLQKYHRELILADVRVGVIMAFADCDEKTGERKGHAIKGYAGAAAGAQVKKVPLKDRLVKKYDVEILIDGDEWPLLGEPEKIALLDHELTHVELRDGQDDLGRPLIKMRKEDFIAWGFWDIIKRHGVAAMEHKALKVLADKHGQLLLNLPMQDAMEGITTMTISTPGKEPVTVTPEQFANVAKNVAAGKLSSLGQEIAKHRASKAKGGGAISAQQAADIVIAAAAKQFGKEP
jgi:hypothetical protein